jgi:hypothetical protein
MIDRSRTEVRSKGILAMTLAKCPLRKTLFTLGLLALALTGTSPAKADMLVSNMTSSAGTFNVPLSYDTSYAQAGAQQFITGDQSTTISSVSVYLGDSTYTGSIVAELLNQVGSKDYNPPGSTVLQTFTTTQTHVANGTMVTFTATSSFTLAANTGYWFSLGTTAGSTGTLNWTAFQNPVTNTGSGSMYDEYLFGASTLDTGVRTGGEFSLAINTGLVSISSVAPEPSSAVIAGLTTLLVSGFWCCRERRRTAS